ncbi:hypothetical protein C8R43DRAFT_1139904 [Mycena crocata]|nr:hypothetical protein C8R43DRAFT_1139904 [Mycena crocata]
MIPKVNMEDIRKGLYPEQMSEIRSAGCVVVKGAAFKEEALAWKHDVRKYVVTNPQVKGYRFPADNIQVYELYNTVSQTRGRTHPDLLETQRVLLSLWHDESGEVALDTPISYFDRLRIRVPGDAKFALGPHVDGGSIERWEDPGYRKCFSKILEGAWKQSHMMLLPECMQLWIFRSQCSIFRPWQGWTAMSSTGLGEGMLPLLSLATAYWILRPFFRACDPASSSLKWEDWNELDLDGTSFAGTGFGAGMALNDESHPHLRLKKTSHPGSTVTSPNFSIRGHCDMIHAVEGYHGGKEDASVMYIPAVPLTKVNAQYLRDQRDNFLAGLPAPDFPGRPGESETVGDNNKRFVEANRILEF